MIGYKVLTKQGLKGPFQKSSILKAITSAMIPLQARLLDLETGRYLSAAELVGERADPPSNRFAAAREKVDTTELKRIDNYVVPESPAKPED
jgi:hypothetical protein